MPNINNLDDIVKPQEALTSVAYERANLGDKKFRRTKDELKKYRNSEITLIDFLRLFSVFVKKFD